MFTINSLEIVFTWVDIGSYLASYRDYHLAGSPGVTLTLRLNRQRRTFDSTITRNLTNKSTD